MGFYSTVNGREIPPPGKAAGDIERLCVIRFALGFPQAAAQDNEKQNCCMNRRYSTIADVANITACETVAKDDK